MSQVNVEIAASGDDTNLFRQSDPVYPPTAVQGGLQATNTTIVGRKNFATPNYAIECTFLRFDTSTIPDDAVITQATLRMFWVGTANPDTRNVNFEWWVWTPTPTHGTDWADVVGTTANVTALSVFTGGNRDFDIALSNPDANISKTGYTGIRWGISGGAPTGVNELFFASWDHATNPAPKLTVDYTEFMGSASAAWLTA